MEIGSAANVLCWLSSNPPWANEHNELEIPISIVLDYYQFIAKEITKMHAKKILQFFAILLPICMLSLHRKS